MEKGESSNGHSVRKGGRNKTSMKLVEREADRLITFSKRKAGINKKAAELCVMCDAQVAFILFSPKGTAFSFGHPDLKNVVNKFLGREEYPVNGDPRLVELIELQRRDKNKGLVEYHNLLQAQVTQFTKHKEFMKQMAASRGDKKGWWDAKVEDMNNVQEVEALSKNIVVFQEALCRHMENLHLVRQASLVSLDQSSQEPFAPQETNGDAGGRGCSESPNMQNGGTSSNGL